VGGAKKLRPWHKFSPLHSIFTASRLQAYGYAIAAIYAAFFISVYHAGVWIVDGKGLPIYTDFACAWTATLQALHSDISLLYQPAEFIKLQAALVAPADDYYPNWPYPPTFFLFFAPFTMAPYLPGFIAWDIMTLLGCLLVIYLIVRRLPAIAVAMASPYMAWNFLAAHNGFLTASLLGASLLCLERQPVLAGLFIGCLTYKPQFGILFPVALAAARKWRAFASASAASATLIGLSVAAFGTDAWQALPREFAAQMSEVLFARGNATPADNWGYIQTMYGLARLLHGGAVVSWLAQGLTSIGATIIVWLIWRSPARYSLKAATLSAAALIVTPYPFAYDMAAIAIPVAFLAQDQLRCGLLRGEQSTAIGLFAVSFAVLVALGDRQGGITFGSVPIGPFAVIILLVVILRRIMRKTRSRSRSEFQPDLNEFATPLG
jgi:arabinofuranan 3-O-arabinosyltransferase